MPSHRRPFHETNSNHKTIRSFGSSTSRTGAPGPLCDWCILFAGRWRCSPFGLSGLAQLSFGFSIRTGQNAIFRCLLPPCSRILNLFTFFRPQGASNPPSWAITVTFPNLRGTCETFAKADPRGGAAVRRLRQKDRRIIHQLFRLAPASPRNSRLPAKRDSRQDFTRRRRPAIFATRAQRKDRRPDVVLRHAAPDGRRPGRIRSGLASGFPERAREGRAAKNHHGRGAASAGGFDRAKKSGIDAPARLKGSWWERPA